MKKFTLVFAGWMMIIVAGVALTYAQDKSANSAVGQDGAMKAEAGKVVAIDTAKNELAVKDEKGAEKNNGSQSRYENYEGREGDFTGRGQDW